MEACNQDGFSHGPFVYASDVRLAPQETRTYLVTAVTAQRRSLFQVTATAELLEQNHPRLSQPGTVPFARVRDYAGPFPRSDYGRPRMCRLKRPCSSSNCISCGGFSFRLKSKADVWMRRVAGRYDANTVQPVSRAVPFQLPCLFPKVCQRWRAGWV
jgi:hypothetical protein